jgi:hypothetical protein
MILVSTDHPCLRVGHHSWYQSHYMYNTSCTILFSKATVRIRLDTHIRTIVVLTYGKLKGIYFVPLLHAIYISVMTHQRWGKKVSILSLGDVNSRLVLSRWGLLEDSPYRVVGATCLLCDWPRLHTYGVET